MTLFPFRNHCEALFLQEDDNNLFHQVKTLLEVNEAPCEFGRISDDRVEPEQENWLTLGGSSRDAPGILTDLSEAPPIPPRSSSRNLSAAQPETELHIPESPSPTMRKCHSPCGLLDRKCSSPSIVRKFGAMLQENEGKVLIDGAVGSCSAPSSAKCNVGCCHSRWSCDASKFAVRKAPDGPVKKSFSEVNIPSARKDSHAGCGSASGSPGHAPLPPGVREAPLDSLLASLEMSPANLQRQGPKRNITLEQKTAEFNRTLFQAEMGRGVEEGDGLAAADARPAGEVDILPDGQNSDAAGSLSASDSTDPGGRRGPDVARASLSCEQPAIVSEEAPAVPGRSPEVERVRAASSPLRKSGHRGATEALFSGSGHSQNIQPGQNEDNSSSKSESPGEAKHQAARGGASLQPSVDNKQRQAPQPRHASAPPPQSDGARPAPRMLNDHPWKPLTLAAYPRPEGSRSNYGALERILKNYESAARAQENQSHRGEAGSSLSSGVQKGETIGELGMLELDPLPLPLSLKHAHAHAQISSYSSVCGTVQVGSPVCTACIHTLMCEQLTCHADDVYIYDRPPPETIPSNFVKTVPLSIRSYFFMLLNLDNLENCILSQKNTERLLSLPRGDRECLFPVCTERSRGSVVI